MHDEPATPLEGTPPDRLGKEPDPPSVRWHQRAGFSLFFDSRTNETGQRIWRTRLYHEESGDETTVQAGELHEWARWILDRLGPLTEFFEGDSPPDGPISVQILSARIVAAEPSITDGVADVEVQAQLLINGLTPPGLFPPVFEVVFGVQRP